MQAWRWLGQQSPAVVQIHNAPRAARPSLPPRAAMAMAMLEWVRLQLGMASLPTSEHQNMTSHQEATARSIANWPSQRRKQQDSAKIAGVHKHARCPNGEPRKPCPRLEPGRRCNCYYCAPNSGPKGKVWMVPTQAGPKSCPVFCGLLKREGDAQMTSCDGERRDTESCENGY